MSAEATEDETIADLAMRATHWRSEAKRFAGQPEAVACLDYAERQSHQIKKRRVISSPRKASSGQRKRLNVRFTPRATEVLHCREITRGANSGRSHPEQMYRAPCWRVSEAGGEL